MLRHKLFVIALLTASVYAVPVPALAQEIGVRAGASADPNQFYFGAHAETPPLLDHLYFLPNVEIGVGDNVTLYAFNVEFAYHLPSGRSWFTYVGAGPALNVIHVRGNTNSEGGFNLLVGVQHEGGLFAELKAGLGNSANLKVGVGYAFRFR